MRYHSRVTQARSAPVAGRQSMQFWNTAFLLLALAMLPALCFARQISVEECVEGGDFIKNAALARDGGMSEAAFMGRIRDDIEVIQAFPPHMRWFVQNDDDAEFLLAAATAVFQKPKQAGDHQYDFIKSCLRKTSSKPLYPL